jgi:hypothetical protein
MQGAHAQSSVAIYGLIEAGLVYRTNAGVADGRCEYHCGGAIATLQAMKLVEPFFQHADNAIVVHSFNGPYVASVRLDSEHSAGTHGSAIERHGVRTGQTKRIAQRVYK